MTKEQKFHFLRAIGDYLERHIKGIDLTYITDFDDGTGIIGVYWYIGDSAEVDLTYAYWETTALHPETGAVLWANTEYIYANDFKNKLMGKEVAAYV